jgi:hypothetical protein
LVHARRFALGFGKVSGTLRIARFSSPALSGSPRRFKSWDESLPMVHPRVVPTNLGQSFMATINKCALPSDLNKLFTL